MTADDPAPEIVILLEAVPERYASLRIIARPVEWNAAESCPRGPDIDGPLDDLTAYARVGGYDDSRPTELWGWTVAYLAPYQVDLRRSERMTAMLRRIARAMDTYERAYGPVQSFPQYLAVFARAVGAKRYAYRVGPRVSSTYADNTYERTSSPARWIDTAAAELAAGTSAA